MSKINVWRIRDILHEGIIAIEQITLNCHQRKLRFIKVIRQPIKHHQVLLNYLSRCNELYPTTCTNFIMSPYHQQKKNYRYKVNQLHGRLGSTSSFPAILIWPNKEQTLRLHCGKPGSTCSRRSNSTSFRTFRWSLRNFNAWGIILLFISKMSNHSIAIEEQRD